MVISYASALTPDTPVMLLAYASLLVVTGVLLLPAPVTTLCCDAPCRPAPSGCRGRRCRRRNGGGGTLARAVQ